MPVILNPQEMAILMQQDPRTEKDGGFQQLLVTLQKKLNTVTGNINLTGKDIERIVRYAFEYGNGGWESMLRSVFGRVLPNEFART